MISDRCPFCNHKLLLEDSVFSHGSNNNNNYFAYCQCANQYVICFKGEDKQLIYESFIINDVDVFIDFIKHKAGIYDLSMCELYQEFNYYPTSVDLKLIASYTLIDKLSLNNMKKIRTLS